MAAWIGLLFFATSVAQTQLHTMFLWKAAYGQLLLVLIFYFFSTKLWRWALIPSLLLLITHKTTSAIFLITTFVYTLITFRNNKKVMLIALGSVIVVSAGAIWYLFSQGLLQNLRSSINPSISNGIFLSVWDYLQYTWLLVPFAVFGLVREFKKPYSLPWIVLLGISIIWIIAALPFHNRVLQYADLSIIYFAAISIATLSWPTKKKFAAVILVVLFSFAQFFLFRQTLSPQITAEEVHEIGKFTEQYPGAFVLSASALDAPWLLAYLYGDIRLAAPGLFEDKNSIEDWKQFWQTPKYPEFLNQYPQPLYIYQRSSSIIQPGNNCFTPVSQNFYKYECQN